MNEDFFYNIYPCTIITARYQGTYEGARWLAFNCDADQIPSDATGDDVSCGNFWSMQAGGMLNYRVLSEYSKSKLIIVGKGESPNLAVEDLAKKLEGSNSW